MQFIKDSIIPSYYAYLNKPCQLTFLSKLNLSTLFNDPRHLASLRWFPTSALDKDLCERRQANNQSNGEDSSRKSKKLLGGRLTEIKIVTQKSPWREMLKLLFFSWTSVTGVSVRRSQSLSLFSSFESKRPNGSLLFVRSCFAAPVRNCFFEGVPSWHQLPQHRGTVQQRIDARSADHWDCWLLTRLKDVERFDGLPSTAASWSSKNRWETYGENHIPRCQNEDFVISVVHFMWWGSGMMWHPRWG